MHLVRCCLLAGALALVSFAATAGYGNFESSHVHPIARSGSVLVAVNTPDARLEVFTVELDGGLTRAASIPVGLEPVSVALRTPAEAWVANHLSDTVSVVDLTQGTVVATIATGDEPTDVVFARGKAFVAVSQEDVVRVYDATTRAPLAAIPIFSRDVRALAARPAPFDDRVYAVSLRSGNRTTVVNAGIVLGNDSGHDPARLGALGLEDLTCDGAPPAQPGLPAGITRNPSLGTFPDGRVPVALIVRWDPQDERWEDEEGKDWTHCLPFRLPDHDLFVIDADANAVIDRVSGLGTSLFEVSVRPGTGQVYVPHTDARNHVRFEHELGVRGHIVDNRVAIVDPAMANAVTLVDLNAHIARDSDPAANLAERQASISQPGMMAWTADGSTAYLTAIGSRKLFRLDGACGTPACIFGPVRAAPDAVVVGEGPTGVALDEAKGRAYVLNRFSNSIALVDLGAPMTKVDEVPLHDPSPMAVREGRRLLYDGIDSSGHGDAACASCHLFGDTDGLAWELGNPEDERVLYSEPNDNVRFIIPFGGVPVECDPALCASQTGFDPQKGPMTTQTFRGMLEPLHWRFDRPTLNDFNPAFVALMGKEDVGPVNGRPAGHTAADMEMLRQFLLGIRFPPNPNRTVQDTIPPPPPAPADPQWFQPPEAPFAGDPLNGELSFDTSASDAGQPCASCHAHPFGAAGGQLGGVEPAEPTSAQATAMFNGNADGSPHNDLGVPHLRNMYEKFGPTFGTHAAPPDRRTGFGFIHDGSIPDMGTFLSANVFTLTADQVADIAAFMFFFPTGTKPAVGRQLTVPPGAPPTGSAGDEALLAALLGLGDLADAARHCELTASALQGGRVRAWHLDGGMWTTDVAAEPPVSTAALRQGAGGPVTFLCATPGSGPRLGGNRDEDAALDGDDCNPADAGAWEAVVEASNLLLGPSLPTPLDWDEQATATGPGVRYDVATGLLSGLRLAGLDAATSCLAGELAAAAATDPRPDPPAGDGYYYLVRARNSCADPGFGPGRAALDDLSCPP